MSVVFLIRHAHSEWTPDEARSLSRQGATAAQQVAARIGGEPITAIYSSPSTDSSTPIARN